jgi:Mlc titration factor MtfA (ptsG expression regulator)
VAVSTGLDDRLLAAAPAIARGLTPDETQRFLDHGERLVRRTHWEAAVGFALDAAVIELVAAHAALLVCGFSPATDPYRDVTAVVLHAGTIVTNETVQGPVRGVVTSAPRYLAGQAGNGRGPVVLDWRTAAAEMRRPEGGSNVVFHEFAHKLDQLDGTYDGMPPLGSNAARRSWEQTFGTNYRRLVRRGADTLTRSYAATNPAEYFAVTSELFFTRPLDLRRQHPRVYAQLAGFYYQDPAARLTPP